MLDFAVFTLPIRSTRSSRLLKGQILRFSDFPFFFSFNRQKIISKVYMNVIFANTTHLLAVNHGRIVTMFYGPKIVNRLLPPILLTVTS